MPSPRFPLGATVTFSDDSAIGPLGDDSVRVCTGIVNGRPVVNPGCEAEYVPLWCERIGREATTVYVSSKNILSVVPAKGGPPA